MHIFLCKTAGHRGGGFGCARQIVKSLLTWNFALWSWGLLVPFWLSREVELKRPRTLHATIAGMPHNHICLRKEPTWRTPSISSRTACSCSAASPSSAVPLLPWRSQFLPSSRHSYPGVHSARRPASERPHRRCGPARSRYLAGRRSHRHFARYARAQHPRGAPMLERH